ncbi:MAG: type II toxin-antitoxin system HicA family toxin [Phycisphaerales bacterium]
MSFKRQKVLAALARRGVFILREGGAHSIVGVPGGAATSLPRHRELDRHTVRAIAKQLGIDPQELTKDIR